MAAQIGLDDPPSSHAGWWPNMGDLDSTTCACASLRMRKILHVYVPNEFSVSSQEPYWGWKSPKNGSRSR
jgi:hypothetical protein